MKNLLCRILFLAFTILGLVGCQNPFTPSVLGIEGTWENTMKNTDGSTLTSNIKITQNGEFFNAVLNLTVSGNESETLKLPSKSLNFSGKIQIQRKSLDINEVESEFSTYKEGSYLLISENGKFLTLYPGEVKFKKK